MSDLLLEQHYYDAALAGLHRGNLLSNAEGETITPEVDKALQKYARRQADQLSRMVVDAPEDREHVAELLDEWLNSGDELSLSDLRAELEPMFGAARALTIARTETGWAMNMGNAAALKANGWSKVMWVAAFDACDTCADLNGQVMDIDEYNDQALQHPNAYMGDTRIEGEIVSALKAFYSGPIFTLETARGHRLTLTANHPVLTRRGFVAAHELRKDDDLFTDSNGAERLPAMEGTVNNQHSPALAEEIFETLRSHALSAAVEVVEMSALDLHGDARFCKGKVEVVGAYAKLLNKSRVKRAQRVVNGLFQGGDMQQPPIASFCPRHLHGEGVFLSAPRSVSGRHLRGSRSGIVPDLSPVRVSSFGQAAQWNVAKPKPSGDDGSRHVAFVRELLDRSAGAIAADEIVEIGVLDYVGHVYDLESKTGWVKGSDYIISNCACTAVPTDEEADADVDDAREETDLDPGETGAGDLDRDPPDVE